MVAQLHHTHYIVLGIINSNLAAEWIGQPDYNTIVTLNSDLATTYGAHFIDIRSYLVSLFNPGIPQDVIDHGHDVIPSSLHSGDSIHLNNAGYQAVANKVFLNIGILQ